MKVIGVYVRRIFSCQMKTASSWKLDEMNRKALCTIIFIYHVIHIARKHYTSQWQLINSCRWGRVQPYVSHWTNVKLHKVPIYSSINVKFYWNTHDIFWLTNDLKMKCYIERYKLTFHWFGCLSRWCSGQDSWWYYLFCVCCDSGDRNCNELWWSSVKHSWISLQKSL